MADITFADEGREHLSYHLPQDFLVDYEGRPVPFGFNIGGGNTLGELTFIDKYSRKKADGTKETWAEVCARVVEGMYSVVKDHCARQRTPWTDEHADEDATEAYDRMFHMKWLPPGRGLQFMGTAYMFEEGSACLQNCSFVSTQNIAKDPVTPFVRLMEMSMLGIGVGMDTRGSETCSIVTEQARFGTERVVVEDSREGWIDLAGRVLAFWLVPGSPLPDPDYSLVRPPGAPIKRFGGTAAGPGPLMELVANLHSIFRKRVYEGRLVVDSRLIADVANMLGRCVVSGNLRRTAEIIFGDAGDKDFLSLKDWTLPENAERLAANTGWGYISNNSILTEMGKDISHIAHQIEVNGEPGVMWLDLAQNYGRLVDPPNYKNWRVKGANPCVEQPLEDNELCTLVETFPAHHDSIEDYKRTLKYAYLYGKAVTLVPTHWPESNEVMVRNRRIGCSMSGVVQFAESRGLPELRQWCDEGYAEICRRDVQYSDWMGIRESIGKTSVKPSGTVSILTGATPGQHFPRKRGRYWRRVRLAKNNPTLALMQDSGYLIEDDVNEPLVTSVVRYPVAGPDVRGEDEVSLWEKVSLAAFLQRYWADNMVSATFSFSDEERSQIPSVLASFEGQLKAASFLPLEMPVWVDDAGVEHTYQQLPYEEADDEEWEAAWAAARRIDTSALYGTSSLEASGDKYCDADGKCSI